MTMATRLKPHSERAISAFVGGSTPTASVYVRGQITATIELLITRTPFGHGSPYGLVLLLCTRKSRPKVKAIFVCPPQSGQAYSRTGEFVPYRPTSECLCRSTCRPPSPLSLEC